MVGAVPVRVEPVSEGLAVSEMPVSAGPVNAWLAGIKLVSAVPLSAESVSVWLLSAGQVSTKLGS